MIDQEKTLHKWGLHVSNPARDENVFIPSNQFLLQIQKFIANTLMLRSFQSTFILISEKNS